MKYNILLKNCRSGLVFAGMSLIYISAFVACPNSSFNLFGTNNQHCSLYKYNQQKGIWTDNTGKQVTCTIVDNDRVFPYYPKEGCEHWKKFYSIDETVQFSKVPIKIGSGPQALSQVYCIKQRYISIDSSDQVLLIDEGVFCLREHPTLKGEYMFSSCDGVYKKNPKGKLEAQGAKAKAKTKTKTKTKAEEKTTAN